MLGLPKSTEFNKRIPKQKFHENLPVTPAIKKAFTEQIKIIYWRNKIAPTTLNLAQGENVTEIEVFEIKLKSKNLDENILWLMDKEIPYHFLFILEYENNYKVAISFKEPIPSGKPPFKVERYYYTDWMTEADLPLHLEGLNLDTVYENFVRQVAGKQLANLGSYTLKASVEKQKGLEDLERKISVISLKLDREKQPKKRFELHEELMNLNKQLDELKHENGENI